MVRRKKKKRSSSDGGKRFKSVSRRGIGPKSMRQNILRFYYLRRKTILSRFRREKQRHEGRMSHNRYEGKYQVEEASQESRHLVRSPTKEASMSMTSRKN